MAITTDKGTKLDALELNLGEVSTLPPADIPPNELIAENSIARLPWDRRTPVDQREFENALEVGRKIAVTNNCGPADTAHVGAGQPHRSTIDLYRIAKKAFDTGEDQTVVVERMGVSKQFTVSGNVKNISASIEHANPELTRIKFGRGA